MTRINYIPTGHRALLAPFLLPLPCCIILLSNNLSGMNERTNERWRPVPVSAICHVKNALANECTSRTENAIASLPPSLPPTIAMLVIRATTFAGIINTRAASHFLRGKAIAFTEPGEMITWSFHYPGKCVAISKIALALKGSYTGLPDF